MLMQAGAMLGAAALVFAAGTWTGRDLALNQVRADNARIAAEQLATYQQSVADGQAAADLLREQLALQGRYHATLEQRIARAPLTVAAACRPAVAAASGVDLLAGVPPKRPTLVPSAPGVPGGAPSGGAAPPGPPDEVGGTGLRLTLAAVSLWNSALAGADVPAGACRAADPTSAACAADAGVGIDQAWANHATNAASCAADRARQASLIAFIKRRGG